LAVSHGPISDRPQAGTTFQFNIMLLSTKKLRFSGGFYAFRPRPTRTAPFSLAAMPLQGESSVSLQFSQFLAYEHFVREWLDLKSPK
jgi:hypothetical protein